MSLNGTVFDTYSPEIVFLVYRARFTISANEPTIVSKHNQPIRAALIECAEILKTYLDISLFDILFPDDEVPMAGQNEIRTARTLRSGIRAGAVVAFMGRETDDGSRS